jgi:hypothetical protein
LSSPNEASNSIGNLSLHLSGNARQWIVCGIGGAEDERVRQQEFDELRFNFPVKNFFGSKSVFEIELTSGVRDAGS